MNVRNPDITGPCHHLKTGARIRAQHEHLKNITTHPALTGEGGNLIAKLRDAYVKNDAGAFARAFTSDGILVTLTGKVLRGQQEIEQGTKTFISSLGGTKDLQVQIEELHALPDGTVWYIGHATIVGNQREIKDHYTVVAVPEGNGYAYKMLNIGVDEPSPR